MGPTRLCRVGTIAALVAILALLPAPASAGWVKLLTNAKMYGRKEEAFTTENGGFKISMVRARWKSGYVTCNSRYSGDSRPWNACNPSHGDVYSFEIKVRRHGCGWHNIHVLELGGRWVFALTRG